MENHPATEPALSDPIFWNTRETARQLGISISRLEKLRFYRDPAGPPFVRLGASVRYPVKETKAWAAAKITAVAGGAE